MNKLYKDLNELYIGKHEELINAINIKFSIEDHISQIIRFFNKGYWTMMPFGIDTYNTYSLRLIPDKQLLDLPVMKYSDSSKNCIIRSSNLGVLIPMLQSVFLTKPRLINRAKSNYESLKKMSKSFRSYTNSEDSLTFLEDFLFSESNQAFLEQPKENYRKTFTRFWEHYNNTPEQQLAFEIFNKMDEDESFFMPFQNKDYGVWHNRVYTALASRVYTETDIYSDIRMSYAWKCSLLPQGSDSEHINFDFLPSSSRTKSVYNHIIGCFDGDPGFTYTPEMLEHPIFNANQALAKNDDTYIGQNHVLAAAVLDEEYNDPISAWNALVTAGYWAGENGGIALEPAWEAAIYLAEKHDWKLIYETLKSQLDFYRKYKNKV